MLMLREHLARVASEKVTKRDDGTYWCLISGAVLVDQVRPRSLWFYPMRGGFGKVAQVRHLFCPFCQPNEVEPNEPGAEPVFTIQLIDVNEELMPTGLMSEVELAARGMARVE
jgi:hypothetical protein